MNKKPQEAGMDRLQQPISFFHKKDIFQASGAYHRHNGYEIYLIHSGNVYFYVEQNCFQPGPGSIILVNPNELHRVQFLDDTPYERSVINLEVTYAESVFPQKLLRCFQPQRSGNTKIRVMSPETLSEYTGFMNGLESSLSPDCYDAETVQQAYLSLILEFINRLFQTEPGNYRNIMPPYIIGTMQLIDENLCEPPSLAALASGFHISENYLSAQFKYHTGLTLRHYILDRKINHAIKMLKTGATVTDACFNSGFNNYANFIRSFKNYTGISPGKYGK